MEGPIQIYPRVKMPEADVSGRPHDGFDALVDYLMNADQLPLPEVGRTRRVRPQTRFRSARGTDLNDRKKFKWHFSHD